MQKKFGQPTRKALNLFFILFVAIGAILAGSAALLYRAELNTFLSEMKERERHTIGRQSAVIGDEFDAIVSDLLFLSRQNELLAYLQRQDAQAKLSMHADAAMYKAKEKGKNTCFMDDNGHRYNPMM